MNKNAQNAYEFTAENFMSRFPDVLRDGANLQALGKTIADALETRYRETITAALYPRIDELDESILDLLAEELKTPFYQPDLRISSKRGLIKQSRIYYNIIGTVGACNRILQAAFPGSYIQEWFDYNGEPYHFRVIVDTSQSHGQTADYGEISNAINQCKRFSAHCDYIFFQCRIDLFISADASGYCFPYPMTGLYPAGTIPDTNTLGFIRDTRITTDADGSGVTFPYALAGENITGTIPDINAAGIERGGGIAPNAAGAGFAVFYPLCGDDHDD